MNKAFVILVCVLLVGVVAAADRITNVNPLELYIPNFVAGGMTSTEFSFDYPNILENYNNAPLVAKVNISSLNDFYPVWKGDFYLSMVAKQYFLPTIFGEIIPINTIPMKCSEDGLIEFKEKDGTGIIYSIDEIPNGIFYCYNPNYYMMQLDSHDEVTLSIGSEPALWPGEYNVSVGLYYPVEEYIDVDVSPIGGSNYVEAGTDATVSFNVSFEIGGGNAVRMKMSDLVDGFIAPDGIGFVIGDGESYSPEDLNARLVYNGANYSVGYDYWNGEPIVFDVGSDGVARGWALFMMDVNSSMASGNYYGSYQFDVSEVLE